MLNPFSGSGFDMVSLTQSINVLPNQYGRVKQMGIFPFRPGTSPVVTIEEQNGVLNLVPTRPWGAPANKNRSGKRRVRSFQIPHMPLEDLVLASDVMGIRAFGTENTLDTVAARVNDKLQLMKNKLDQTVEYRMTMALQGVILDADGSTIYNIFDEYGLTRIQVDFALGTAGTNVRQKAMDVLAAIEDNLMGETMSGVHALVSTEFFSKLINHQSVKDDYRYYLERSNGIGADPRKGFTYAGITFEEYRASTPRPDMTSARYIAANDGAAFPEGAAQTFGNFGAPADFIETVNTLALEYYARQANTDFNRGTEIHTQCNVLPWCNRPLVLVRVFTSN